MTNIFSSKVSKELEAVKADNVNLKKVVDGMQPMAQELTAMKSELEKVKTESQQEIATMKQDFSKEVNALKEQVKALTEAKAAVEQQAKVEVEKAKEVTQETLNTKVNEGIAAKVAAMGITEDKLPTISPADKMERITIVRHGNNQ